jgi:hypothetical protein
MFELLQQPIQMMERTASFWQNMAADGPWLKNCEALDMNVWGRWITMMRAANEMSNNAWKTMVEGSEETFFKMLKESRLYGQTLEAQLRDGWANVKQSQTTRKEAIEEILGKMESLAEKTATAE